jgi:MinD-like ATPase involved in chromosome partitioning or flagellar assembly
MESMPRDDVRLNMVSGALRRHAVLIVLLVIGFGVGAGAYAASLPPTYVATSSVLLRATQGNALSPALSSSGPEITIAMGTESGAALSPRVAVIASKILGSKVQPQSPAILVTSPPNTMILEIQYTAGSAKNAQSGAQAIAEALLQYRRERALSARQYELDALKAQQKAATADLAKWSAAASVTKAPPEAAQQLQLHASQLATLQNSVGALLATDASPGTLIGPAVLPTTPSGLTALVLIPIGLVFGLAVGMVFAIWRGLRDDRVQATAESTIDGLPILAYARRSPGSASPGLSVPSDTVLADAYRQARAGIQAVTQSPCSLAVSDLSNYRHAGEVVANLGVCLAGARHSVTVVSAVPRGDLEELMDVNHEPGLTDVLKTGQAPAAFLRETQSVHVLAIGSDRSEVRDLVASERFTSALASLKTEADFVIVAAGPAMSAEGATVALATDAMVLVVEDRRTTHREVGRMLDRFNQLNINVIGAICVPVGRRGLFTRRDRTTTPGPTGHQAEAVLNTTTESVADKSLLGTPSAAARIGTAAEQPSE